MKLIKQSVPISDSVPRNTFILTVRSMHGDADQFTKESHAYSEDQVCNLKETIKLLCAAFAMGYDAHDTSKVQRELEEVGKDFDMEYPSDVYTDLVGYDIMSDGNFLAMPQKLSVVWYDSNGVKFPVDIELDNGKVFKEITEYTKL